MDGRLFAGIRLRARRPRSRGDSRPHKSWHEGREPRKGGFGALCEGVAVAGRLFAGIRMRARRPRSRGDSRPHKAWHEGREPRKGGFGALCEGVAVDGRLFAGIRLRARRPRSRGDSRPHKSWHEGREPRKGGFGALCEGVAVDGRLFAGIRMRARRPRSRGDSQVVLPGSSRGIVSLFPTLSPGPTGSARCFAAGPGRWRGRSSEILVRSTCWRRPRRAPAGRRACRRPGTPPGSA